MGLQKLKANEKLRLSVSVCDALDNQVPVRSPSDLHLVFVHLGEEQVPLLALLPSAASVVADSAGSGAETALARLDALSGRVGGQHGAELLFGRCTCRFQPPLSRVSSPFTFFFASL
jgi:hypothetical protein